MAWRAPGARKLVTALGETNDAGGWRQSKATSGCLIDVESGETLVRGLAMPHSPRIHAGRTWLLNSGRGQLVVADLAQGRVTTVTELPGYTRGLAMLSTFAFVGLSRIRETSTFGGLPIAENRESLKCGVAVVNLNSGRQMALLEFHTGVEEIFDIQLLPGIRSPVLSGPHPHLDGNPRSGPSPPRPDHSDRSSGFPDDGEGEMDDERAPDNRPTGPRRWILTALAVVMAGACLWDMAARWMAPKPGDEMPPGDLPLSSPYRNTIPGVAYVGDEVSARCHGEIRADLSPAPDGAVDVVPAESKVAANGVVFQVADLVYSVLRRDGHMFHREEQHDDKGRTIAASQEEVRYVLGSGRRGLAFLVGQRMASTNRRSPGTPRNDAGPFRLVMRS